MAMEETLLELLQSTDTLVRAHQDTQLQVYAVQTAVIGLLRAFAQQPEQLAAIAKEISLAAEGGHGVALGYSVPDDWLQRREAVLRDMLPLAMRPLVKLPTQS